MNTLPPEVIQLVINFVDYKDRYHLLSVGAFYHSVKYILFQQPQINSLRSFDNFLKTLEADPDRDHSVQDDGRGENLSWRQIVRSVRLECRERGIKGWGTRISRLFNLCDRISTCEVVGVEDFRLRSISTSNTLKTLTLRSTTFKPHSLPSPPGLSSALSNITSLTLSNLGLPSPSTHLSAILSATPQLIKLHLSGLRDLTATALPHFTDGLIAVKTKLKHLTLGMLTQDQSDELAVHLPNFISLTLLDLTLPLPLSNHIAALPRNLSTLSVRRNSYSKLEEEWATVQAVLSLASGDGPVKIVRLWKGMRGARNITEKLKLRGIIVLFVN